jgi:phosphatidylethanolamine/phosphatidyl-N-methylethanolamine N-methyltransferase
LIHKSFFQAILSQPKFELFSHPAVYGIGIVLAVLGQIFAITSIYQLGVTGTYLGDYFGIYMKERVTAFPFNTLEHPMYHGAVMTFVGTSLM